jgi:hypothetical protein
VISKDSFEDKEDQEALQMTQEEMMDFQMWNYSRLSKYVNEKVSLL